MIQNKKVSHEAMEWANSIVAEIDQQIDNKPYKTMAQLREEYKRRFKNDKDANL